ncbi:NAD(P)H-dependent oxidoreductase [Vibrio mangrovi]|uniref:NAD(P)H-dependent oxidoreductase n=1 Tax=Vibrio mangrovi TaxID=474394 RepID=A0A1Y6IT60_9VIBR|nr:NAD(P)H-dependent oxidoreductase [Vibrio mangrovi]MDW6004547.1 NAD(P)H-dependent oxidoreductase [Vibrio mangrovi]SMS00835.1 Putative NAD(P)H nitroreductase YfkO [Vibrio mangrovi]
MSTIAALQWRYSLKNFSNQKVDDDKINNLLEAARLSASSYGLQPYQVWVIQERDLLAKLSEQAFGQSQVRECSHLLVFANETVISDATVERYFARHYQQTQTPVGSLDGYADHIKSAMAEKSDDSRRAWAEQQAYIALGTVLTEAAVLGIDTCPMTGFDQQAFNQTLGLSQYGLSACVICAIGYREADMQSPVKVRIPREHFVRFVSLKG